MNGRDLRTRLERVFERKLTEAEVARLARMQREFDIDDNDALSSIVGLVSTARIEVEEFSRDMPQRLKQEFQTARRQALAEAATHEKEIEARLSAARLEGKETGFKQAKEHYANKKSSWTFKFMLCVAVLVGTYVVADRAGYDRGFEEGTTRTQWADTPDGKAAWRLVREGWTEWLQTDAGKAVAEMVAAGRANWLAKVDWSSLSRWDVDTMNKLMKCELTSLEIRYDESGRRFCSTTKPSAWWMPSLF